MDPPVRWIIIDQETTGRIRLMHIIRVCKWTRGKACVAILKTMFVRVYSNVLLIILSRYIMAEFMYAERLILYSFFKVHISLAVTSRIAEVFRISFPP